MSIVMDVVNELDDIRNLDGTDKLKELLGCKSKEDFLADKALVDQYGIYIEYLRASYIDYVDAESIRRSGWHYQDIDLVVDRKADKSALGKLMKEIGKEDFLYSNLSCKAIEGGLMNRQYVIFVSNPEKFSDDEKTIAILKEQHIATVSIEDTPFLDRAVAEDRLVRIDPIRISRVSSKPLDIAIRVRVITSKE